MWFFWYGVISCFRGLFIIDLHWYRLLIDLLNDKHQIKALKNIESGN